MTAPGSSDAAELLRVESPSAEVMGHGPGQKTIVAGPSHVGILALEPVGNYAIRIKFDDLHDTGLYSWRYLYELGRDQEKIWAGVSEGAGGEGSQPRSAAAPLIIIRAGASAGLSTSTAISSGCSHPR